MVRIEARGWTYDQDTYVLGMAKHETFESALQSYSTDLVEAHDDAAAIVRARHLAQRLAQLHRTERGRTDTGRRRERRRSQ